MPDPEFANPRLAALYDHLDHDRTDLDHYLAMVKEFNAKSVLDIGCGTGALLCRLAEQELELVGVDPAQASLNIALSKYGADRVNWICGDATTLPELKVDLAFMTGNVAQVFIDDEDWYTNLSAIRSKLKTTGHLVFEVRDPAKQAWFNWTREKTLSVVNIPDIGEVESWVELTKVSLPMVSFKWTYVFNQQGDVLTSESTLRFREKEEIEESLINAGFNLQEVRTAPDRPDAEMVFVSGTKGS